jgi:hypothetical protein
MGVLEQQIHISSQKPEFRRPIGVPENFGLSLHIC